jgi:hypothetical protein
MINDLLIFFNIIITFFTFFIFLSSFFHTNINKKPQFIFKYIYDFIIIITYFILNFLQIILLFMKIDI